MEMCWMKVPSRIVTSIKIDEELWKEAKKKAIDEGKTLAEFVEGCIGRQLNSSRRE